MSEEPLTIAELLALWRDHGRSSAQVKTIALDHVAVLKRRIAELEGIARSLEALAEGCCGDARPDCPILDDLADHAAVPIPQGQPRRSSKGAGIRRATA